MVGNLVGEMSRLAGRLATSIGSERAARPGGWSIVHKDPLYLRLDLYKARSRSHILSSK